MTDHPDLLQTLAQVFIAFAGFSGVVAAFSTIRLSPEATVFRVRALVVVALLCEIASLLPFLMITIAASETAALRISSFLVGAGMCVVGRWVWRQLSSLYSANLLDTKKYAVLLSMAAVPIAIGLFAVAAGMAREFAEAIYLSSLYLGLFICSYYFVMVIIAVEVKTRK